MPPAARRQCRWPGDAVQGGTDTGIGQVPEVLPHPGLVCGLSGTAPASYPGVAARDPGRVRSTWEKHRLGRGRQHHATLAYRQAPHPDCTRPRVHRQRVGRGAPVRNPILHRCAAQRRRTGGSRRQGGPYRQAPGADRPSGDGTAARITQDFPEVETPAARNTVMAAGCRHPWDDRTVGSLRLRSVRTGTGRGSPVR